MKKTEMTSEKKKKEREETRNQAKERAQDKENKDGKRRQQRTPINQPHQGTSSPASTLAV